MYKKGFTLIELMVVIAIIAVLAAVVAPQVFRQIAKGRIASAEAFHNSVKTASTSYFADTGVWPATCNQVTCNTAAGANGGFIAAATTNPGWDGPYLDRWPPANANPWSGNYTWNSVAAGVNFGAVAAGERWLNITLVPRASAQRIDNDIDRALGNATGMVRYPAAGANITVSILVSRDGAVN